MTTTVRSFPRGRITRPQRISAVLMVMPFLLAFGATYLLPLLYSAYLSLFTSQLIGGQAFGGFANYARALQDDHFWGGVSRVGIYIAVAIPLLLVASITLSLCLDSGKVRGAGFVRLGMFVPYAVPAVVATLMWGYLYGDRFGLIAQVAHSLGLPAPGLLRGGTILGSIINISFWEFVGYNVVILYSALRAIPPEIYEAAKMDGAGAWRTAISIKLPAIRPAIILTVIFSLIGSFQLFNEPNLLSLLAPSAIGTDYTPNLYAYNVAFQNQDINYAAAISFLLGALTVAASYFVQLLVAKRERQL